MLNLTDYPEKNVDVFYITSLKFIDYLVSRYDMESLQNVLRFVAGGEELEAAFSSELGNTVRELFANWQGAFF